MFRSQPPRLLSRKALLRWSGHDHKAASPAYNQFRACASCAGNSPGLKPPKTLTPANSDIPPADHHFLGRSLDLFSSTHYSAGSPLLHPDGSHLFLKLQALLRAQHSRYGFREVVTPVIYKKALWERSGHWDNYGEDMFQVQSRALEGSKKDQKDDHRAGEEDDAWGLKPMNCPGHCLLFATKQRSYRDLPIRYADFSPLHRNEVSGSLSGLTRVRRFHQDDGHIFCRPDQVREEISKTLQMINLIYSAFGLRPHKLLLSTRPETNFIGTVEEWEQAERQLQEALDGSGLTWSINEGDGAFYGPKIDVVLRDNQGKEHQTATIQLDFQLPQRFELSYTSPPSSLASSAARSTPILIHRAVLGSLERFLALLIEHYAGSFPLWLSPRQVKILTTNDSRTVVDHARSIAASLSGASPAGSEPVLRSLAHLHDTYLVDVDDGATTLGKKARMARQEKWCVICTVGEKEASEGTVAVTLAGATLQARLEKNELLQRIVATITSGTREKTEETEAARRESGQQVILDSNDLKPLLDRMVQMWM